MRPLKKQKLSLAGKEWMERDERRKFEGLNLWLAGLFRSFRESYEILVRTILPRPGLLPLP